MGCVSRTRVGLAVEGSVIRGHFGESPRLCIGVPPTFLASVALRRGYKSLASKLLAAVMFWPLSAISTEILRRQGSHVASSQIAPFSQLYFGKSLKNKKKQARHKCARCPSSPLWVMLPYLSLFASSHTVTQSNAAGGLFVFSARLSGRLQPIA